MHKGIIFAKLEPESGKVKRDQRQLSNVLQYRCGPEIKYKSKVVLLNQIPSLGVEDICQLSCPGACLPSKALPQTSCCKNGRWGWWWGRTCRILLEVRVSSSRWGAALLGRLAWQGRKAEGGAKKATYLQARAGNHLAPAQLVKQQQGEKSVILPSCGSGVLGRSQFCQVHF